MSGASSELDRFSCGPRPTSCTRRELERELDHLVADHLEARDAINLSFYLNQFETNRCDLSELLSNLMESVLVKLPDPMIKYRFLICIKRLYLDQLDWCDEGFDEALLVEPLDEALPAPNRRQLDQRLFEATARRYLVASSLLRCRSISGLNGTGRRHRRSRRHRTAMRRPPPEAASGLTTSSTSSEDEARLCVAPLPDPVSDPLPAYLSPAEQTDVADTSQPVAPHWRRCQALPYSHHNQHRQHRPLQQRPLHSDRRQHHHHHHHHPKQQQASKLIEAPGESPRSADRLDVFGLAGGVPEMHRLAACHATRRQPVELESFRLGLSATHQTSRLTFNEATHALSRLSLGAGDERVRELWSMAPEQSVEPRPVPADPEAPISTAWPHFRPEELYLSRSGPDRQLQPSVPHHYLGASESTDVWWPAPKQYGFTETTRAFEPQWPGKPAPVSGPTEVDESNANGFRPRCSSALSLRSQPATREPHLCNDSTGADSSSTVHHQQSVWSGLPDQGHWPAEEARWCESKQRAPTSSWSLPASPFEHDILAPSMPADEACCPPAPLPAPPSFEHGPATNHRRRAGRRIHLGAGASELYDLNSNQPLATALAKPSPFGVSDRRRETGVAGSALRLTQGRADEALAIVAAPEDGRLPMAVAEQMKAQASSFVHKYGSSHEPADEAHRWNRKPELQVRRTLRVRIKKSKPILGIAIEGGFNVSGQLLPRIVCVHEDGAAYQCGKLRASDLILEVNGLSTVNMTHDEIAKTIASAYYQDPRSHIEFIIGESVHV